MYNTFIWPCFDNSDSIRSSANASQKEGGLKARSGGETVVKPDLPTVGVDSISAAAQTVLDIRNRYLDADPRCTLAMLYDPLKMPPDLLKAHQHLDALVDKAYGKKFANDAERGAHLIDLYAATVKGA